MIRPTVITQPEDPSLDRDIELPAMNDADLEANGTGLTTEQVRNTSGQEERSMSSGSATSVLDNPDFRSSRLMSISVWVLVITVTLLASAQLLYIHVGYSDPHRLKTLLLVALVNLPASCYAWALVGLYVWNETSYHNFGHDHLPRLIRWQFTPKASHMMMLYGAFGPIGIIVLTLLEVHAWQRPWLGPPNRNWAWWLLLGSYGAISTYFAENIMINLMMFVKVRFRRQG